MKPESILKLRKHPQFRELITFLLAEMSRLSSFEGLAALPFDERGYEVTSRLRAHEILAGIIAPLTDTVDKPTGVNPSEYAV